MTPEDKVVLATYALVIATGLLVLATAIPAVQRWREQRSERISRASVVVPDMNILHSRLNGTVERLASGRALSEEGTSAQIEAMITEIGIISEIIRSSYAVGLEFANEMYLVRHHLTQARIELDRLADSYDEAENQDLHAQRQDSTRRIQVLYKAADLDLMAGEQLLPSTSRSVQGKSFWERFSSVGRVRETEAEKALVDLRSARRD